MKNEVCKKSLSGKHNFVNGRADIVDLPYFPNAWKRSDNNMVICAYCGIIDDENSFSKKR